MGIDTGPLGAKKAFVHRGYYNDAHNGRTSALRPLQNEGHSQKLDYQSQSPELLQHTNEPQK